jgi:lipopolysaccharide transport system ATP-binding protein
METGDVMSDGWSIRARGLTKVYRLYRRPAYRLLDLFGLCPAQDRYYVEHAAVDHLDLTISPGEKVAIIGRNGAGKSTLLKLISGVLRPTSGSIEVRGSLKALLEIGTGFHPEFTGRDNVLASLAYQGLVGAEASRKLEEIVDFAELGEYIDQPMKTYSSGMMVRLMFSAASCVEPDVLVADEVLNVGDAYFSQKSFARLKELSDRREATFVLVTHDFYSALNVCDRFVWVEKGRVGADGPGKAVVSAYEFSIKEQEEIRQRAAKIRGVAGSPRPAPVAAITLRFSALGAHTIDSPFILAGLEAVWSDGTSRALPMETAGIADAVRWLPGSSVARSRVEERPCLRWAEYGDLFHTMEFVLQTDAQGQGPRLLSVEYQYAGTVAVAVNVSHDGRRFENVAALPPSGVGWKKEEIIVDAGASTADGQPSAHSRHRYGTADITIERVRLLGASGEETAQFENGRSVEIEIEYRVRNLEVARHNVVAIAFHKDGAIPATRFVHSDWVFQGQYGTVRLFIPKLRLAQGRYTLSIAIFRPELAKRLAVEFFATSENIIDFLVRSLEFEVIHEVPLESGVVYLEDCEWR